VERAAAVSIHDLAKDHDAPEVGSMVESAVAIEAHQESGNIITIG
jgi:hypothetical protein